MITYWPNKQSIKLNLAVANLFVQTYQKFSQPLINKTINDKNINMGTMHVSTKCLTRNDRVVPSSLLDGHNSMPYFSCNT